MKIMIINKNKPLSAGVYAFLFAAIAVLAALQFVTPTHKVEAQSTCGNNTAAYVDKLNICYRGTIYTRSSAESLSFVSQASCSLGPNSRDRITLVSLSQPRIANFEKLCTPSPPLPLTIPNLDASNASKAPAAGSEASWRSNNTLLYEGRVFWQHDGGNRFYVVNFATEGPCPDYIESGSADYSILTSTPINDAGTIRGCDDKRESLRISNSRPQQRETKGVARYVNSNNVATFEGITYEDEPGNGGIRLEQRSGLASFQDASCKNLLSRTERNQTNGHVTYKFKRSPNDCSQIKIGVNFDNTSTAANTDYEWSGPDKIIDRGTGESFSLIAGSTDRKYYKDSDNSCKDYILVAATFDKGDIYQVDGSSTTSGGCLGPRLLKKDEPIGGSRLGVTCSDGKRPPLSITTEAAAKEWCKINSQACDDGTPIPTDKKTVADKEKWCRDNGKTFGGSTRVDDPNNPFNPRLALNQFMPARPEARL